MNAYNSLTYYDKFSYQQNGSLREFIDSTYMKALIEKIGKQCIIVLGGDGTMLRAIHSHSEKNIPFV